MKVLRVVFGLGSNFADIEVPDNFQIEGWAKAVRADDGVFVGPTFWVNRSWLQSAMVLSPENAAQAHTQGMVKQ